MNTSPFDIFHPSIPLVYYTGMLIFVMSCFEPIYLFISFLTGIACASFSKGTKQTLKTLAWQIPMIALISIVNPFFSAAGSTELFKISLTAIYAESLVYGACMGLLLASMVLWIECATHSISMDDFISLFGNVMPTITLMTSMVARSLPKLARDGKDIMNVQSACTSAKTHQKTSMFKTHMRTITVLMSNAFEDSLETADAMKCACWSNERGRSVYKRYEFKQRDTIALLLVAAAIGITAALAIVACKGFSLYPTITPLKFQFGHVAFALFATLPLILGFYERRNSHIN